MAITSFIDPFGSMVQGYKEGQQTEIQRQTAQRDVRDSDYNFGQRQIRDPLLNQQLKVGLDQALLDYLTAEKQNPLKTSTMQETLAGLQRQAEVERQTQAATIAAANMKPGVVDTDRRYTEAAIRSSGYRDSLTQQQIAQAIREGDTYKIAQLMLNQPESISAGLYNRGVPLDSAATVGQRVYDQHNAGSPSAMIPAGQGGASVMPPVNAPPMTIQSMDELSRNAAYAKIMNDLQWQMPNATDEQRLAAAQQIFMQNGGDSPFFIARNPDGTVTPSSASTVQEYTGVPVAAPAPVVTPAIDSPAAVVPATAPAPAVTMPGPPPPVPTFSDAGFPINPLNRGVTSLDPRSLNQRIDRAAEIGALVGAEKEKRNRLAELAIIERNVAGLEASGSPLAAQARANLEAKKLMEMGGPAPQPAPAQAQVAAAPVPAARPASVAAAPAPTRAQQRVSAQNASSVGAF